MNKVFTLIIIWVSVIAVYVFIGFLMPFYQDISASTVIALNASANMTDYPGTLEAVESMPLWIWFIPGPVGLVATATTLKFNPRNIRIMK
jgi:hypothetical protein